MRSEPEPKKKALTLVENSQISLRSGITSKLSAAEHNAVLVEEAVPKI